MAVMLRVTPGVPFPLQNYLLGLAGMPFAKYMLISVPLNAVMCSSLILFGDALMKGSVGIAIVGVVAFVILALGTRWLRLRLREKGLEESSNGVG